jgi:DNA-binding protein HU-beta
MTKAEIIEQMAQAAGISKADATKCLNAILAGIETAIKGQSRKISLTGFGTFSNVSRKARQGVNPLTGEKITIRARNVVKFQPSKALKDAVA